MKLAHAAHVSPEQIWYRSCMAQDLQLEFQRSNVCKKNEAAYLSRGTWGLFASKFTVDDAMHNSLTAIGNRQVQVTGVHFVISTIILITFGRT